MPAEHPLRLIRAVVDEALDVLPSEFDWLYARFGRNSHQHHRADEALFDLPESWNLAPTQQAAGMK